MDADKKLQKNKRIEEEIFQRTRSVFRTEELADLSIRDICQRIGITTGMFYRHFRNKNDLLSFFYIDEVRKQLDAIICDGLSLEEQLVEIEMAVVRSSLVVGPNGLLLFLNNENPACDCSVSRGMASDRIIQAILSSGRELSSGKTPQLIADQMTVMLKGLIFEYYTKKDDPSFDLISFAHKLYTTAVPSLCS